MIETQDPQAAPGRRQHRTVWIFGSAAVLLIALVGVRLYVRKPAAHGAARQVVKLAGRPEATCPKCCRSSAQSLRLPP